MKLPPEVQFHEDIRLLVYRPWVDIYFASQPPDGRESNWVSTSANGKFEALFRFYGARESALR